MYYALVKSPITAGKIFKEHLSEKLLNDGFNPEMVIDFSKIFIMAHSCGSHVVVNYLKVNFFARSLASKTPKKFQYLYISLSLIPILA